MSNMKQRTDALLQIENLAVTFYTKRDIVHAVREASFQVHRGEVVGLVGESGCGKSTTALATMGYLQGTADVDGSILFEGKDIVKMSDSELRRLGITDGTSKSQLHGARKAMRRLLSAGLETA